MRYNKTEVTAGPHCLLSSLRRYIYEEIIAPAKTLKQKKAIIADLLEIFVKQIVHKKALMNESPDLIQLEADLQKYVASKK